MCAHYTMRLRPSRRVGPVQVPGAAYSAGQPTQQGVARQVSNKLMLHRLCCLSTTATRVLPSRLLPKCMLLKACLTLSSTVPQLYSAWWSIRILDNT